MSAALGRIEIAPRPLAELTEACGHEAIDRIRTGAEAAKGVRVLHVTAAGGASPAPQLLVPLLALLTGLGVAVEWRVLVGDADLTNTARALEDGLQGAETAIDDGAWSAYLDGCAGAARDLEDDWDLVVLHDPGTIGMAGAMSAGLWRCHLDVSAPDPPTWERARAPVGEAARTVMAHESFAPPGLAGEVSAIAPGIDPLSARNAPLDPRTAGRLVRALGVDLDRPLAAAAMRLDLWGDPHLLIDAFDELHGVLPAVQLVLALEQDGGDWAVLKEIGDYAGARKGLHVVTSLSGLGDAELGALNQLARVALRAGPREGFGLGASEAMWRATPVVGCGGGAGLQVRDGVDGRIAADPAGLADCAAELVGDPGLALAMGRSGRERVRERFLVTRALEDELALIAAGVSG